MMKFFIAASALLVVATAPALAQDRTNRGMMRYDANGDGFVDRTEWAAGQEARFRQLDTDKDGFVSKAEFLAQTERNFARCDLDKDGRINTAECRQALQRRPADKARLER